MLLALWLLLSQSRNPAHVAVGLVAATGIALLHVNWGPRRSYSVRWWNALAYFPLLFVKILTSGIRLCYLILHPRLPIRPMLFRYPTKLGNDLATTLLGNSITLTPGTVTVEADPDELVIHAIDGGGLPEVGVRDLEKRVSNVFPTARGQR